MLQHAVACSFQRHGAGAWCPRMLPTVHGPPTPPRGSLDLGGCRSEWQRSERRPGHRALGPAWSHASTQSMLAAYPRAPAAGAACGGPRCSCVHAKHLLPHERAPGRLVWPGQDWLWRNHMLQAQLCRPQCLPPPVHPMVEEGGVGPAGRI